MNVYVGGNGKGQWFLQAGGNLVPVSKGDVVQAAARGERRLLL